jgi:outer membrane protein W
MKYLFFIISALTTTNLLFAQTKFNIGASFNYTPSTLINRTPPHDETGIDFDFKLKNNIGGQLNFAYRIKNSWSIIGTAGYSQKGARFANSEADYLPRYRFSYLDFSLGASYQFNTEKKLAPFVSASLTQHHLLTATLKNSFEETDIKSDISKTDIGLHIAVGTDYELTETHTIQFSLFYNQGFLNVFDGIYKENGLQALNSVFGVRVGYNFGIATRQKKNAP